MDNKDSAQGCIFGWTTALWKILAVDRLCNKRGIAVEDWCCVCKESGEIVDHLLLHYFEAGEELCSGHWSFLYLGLNG